ncbi:MAG: asparagine synthase (glutamine-hydrolyzing) [Marinilabiliales bacterium]
MCGIAGIYDFKNKVSLTRLKAMADSLVHRGPDGEGFFMGEDKNIGLGHRRLSIIDLSHDADQPMHFNELTLIFNGEIYNYLEIKEELIKLGYSFKTNSDTEVLLKAFHHYRESVLNLLDGMFAFAVWDEKNKELFCARDRFGEKPFYYYYDENSFVFASEMKALWAYGIEKKVNLNMVYYYYTYDVIENPYTKAETFFDNIYKLEAAYYIKIGQDRRLKKRKYWEIDKANKNDNISDKEAINKFKDLFHKSIIRRLRSDVPLGSSLSGGLDSSTVVVVNNKFINSQYTFTARFDNPEYDEGHFVDILKERYSLNSYNTFPATEELAEEFDKLFYYQEEPFQTASIFAQWEVMKLAKANNVTVLLDGQGADEILAGYHKYFLFYLKELYVSDKKMFHKELQGISKLHNKDFYVDLDFKLSSSLPYLRRSISQLIRNTGLKKQGLGLNKEIINHNKKRQIPFYTGNNLNEALHFDTFSYGLEKLLRFADRNAMAHSREIRLPFLSHELVEFIFTLPSHFKIRNGWTKYILRKSYETELTGKIAWRIDKKGYQMPMENLFEYRGMKELVNNAYKKLKKEKVIEDKPVNYYNSWKLINLAKLWEK